MAIAPRQRQGASPPGSHPRHRKRDSQMKAQGIILSTLLTLVMTIGVACESKTPDAPPAPEPEPAPAAPTTPGVDALNKVIKVGALNDESGPGAAIGKPFAIGKRVLYESINAGDTTLLPKGWKVKLVEKDHGYNPQQAVQAYKEIKEDVLYIATSFGTPNTMPLKPLLKADGMVAFPASLSSEMAGFANTPPIGASYRDEARRAMDWAIMQAGGADKLKAGIVFQQDDYGADGMAGWQEAAALHGVTVVSQQAIAPGQSDFAAVVTALKNDGANYVLLTTLPSATGPILGTAAQLGYSPTWIGNTPSWIDAFFNPQVIPAAVFGNFHLMSGLPYWGEDVPGMKEFIAAYDAHGKALHQPDSYILLSYIQGLAQVAALKRSIQSLDMTREGYMNALHTLNAFNAGGMIQTLDLSRVPYRTGTRTRVLKPKMSDHTWEVGADYAEPMKTAYVPGKKATTTKTTQPNRVSNGVKAQMADDNKAQLLNSGPRPGTIGPKGGPKNILGNQGEGTGPRGGTKGVKSPK